MKKILSVLFVVLLLVSCSDKTEVSGTLTTEVRTVDDYTKISVADGIVVKINRGTKGEVTVRTFTSVFDYVQTSVVDNTLVIKVIDKTRFDRNPNISITLSTEGITALDILDGSKVTAENTFVADNKANLMISGGGSFEGNIATGEFGLMLSGGSTTKINGTATITKIGCEGGANIDGKNFETEFLDVVLSGGSVTYMQVTEKINFALLKNGSKLYYKGPTPALEDIKIYDNSKIETF